MPYDPSVNDRSGEIFAQASANSAAIRAQGTADFTNALNSSFNTAMGMFSSNMTKAEENRVASDGANAKFDMLKDYKKTDGTPLMTQEVIEKFDTMPLGKRQAYVQTAEAILDDDLKKWMYQTQYNAQANRINAYNQVPANQQPMSPLGTNASANNAAPQTQSIFTNPNIKTKDQLGN